MTKFKYMCALTDWLPWCITSTYGFMSSFHTFSLTWVDLLLALRPRGIYFIFSIWLQLNLFQFWVFFFYFLYQLACPKFSFHSMHEFLLKVHGYLQEWKMWIILEELDSLWSTQLMIPSNYYWKISEHISFWYFYKQLHILISFICTSVRCVTCTNGGINMCLTSHWDIGCLFPSSKLLEFIMIGFFIYLLLDLRVYGESIESL